MSSAIASSTVQLQPISSRLEVLASTIQIIGARWGNATDAPSGLFLATDLTPLNGTQWQAINNFGVDTARLESTPTTITFDSLSSKPEQEQFILGALAEQIDDTTPNSAPRDTHLSESDLAKITNLELAQFDFKAIDPSTLQLLSDYRRVGMDAPVETDEDDLDSAQDSPVDEESSADDQSAPNGREHWLDNPDSILW